MHTKMPSQKAREWACQAASIIRLQFYNTAKTISFKTNPNSPLSMDRVILAASQEMAALAQQAMVPQLMEATMDKLTSPTSKIPLDNQDPLQVFLAFKTKLANMNMLLMATSNQLMQRQQDHKTSRR